MTPLTENPTVVLFITHDGVILKMATNVAPDLKVVLVGTNKEFENQACNQPFKVDFPQNKYINFVKTSD